MFCCLPPLLSKRGFEGLLVLQSEVLNPDKCSYLPRYSEHQVQNETKVAIDDPSSIFFDPFEKPGFVYTAVAKYTAHDYDYTQPYSCNSDQFEENLDAETSSSVVLTTKDVSVQPPSEHVESSEYDDSLDNIVTDDTFEKDMYNFKTVRPVSLDDPVFLPNEISESSRYLESDYSELLLGNDRIKHVPLNEPNDTKDLFYNEGKLSEHMTQLHVYNSCSTRYDSIINRSSNRKENNSSDADSTKTYQDSGIYEDDVFLDRLKGMDDKSSPKTHSLGGDRSRIFPEEREYEGEEGVSRDRGCSRTTPEHLTAFKTPTSSRNNSDVSDESEDEHVTIKWEDNNNNTNFKSFDLSGHGNSNIGSTNDNDNNTSANTSRNGISIHGMEGRRTQETTDHRDGKEKAHLGRVLPAPKASNHNDSTTKHERAKITKPVLPRSGSAKYNHVQAKVQTRRTHHIDASVTTKRRCPPTMTPRYPPMAFGRPDYDVRPVNFRAHARSKVKSLDNLQHIPGGGTTKIFQQKLNFRDNAEPRTDTHGLEMYSHLPAEFQEIARRLATQNYQLKESDRQLARGRSRTSSTSTLMSSRASSRSPSRSRRSTTGTPRRVTPTTSLNCLYQAGSKQIDFDAPPKPHDSLSRSSSVRSVPLTPSLSRNHPATSFTLYDKRSRSRPSSPSWSRSVSPAHSRSQSPSRHSGGSRPVSPGATRSGFRSRSTSAPARHSARQPTAYSNRTSASTSPRARAGQQSLFHYVPAVR